MIYLCIPIPSSPIGLCADVSLFLRSDLDIPKGKTQCSYFSVILERSQAKRGSVVLVPIYPRPLKNVSIGSVVLIVKGPMNKKKLPASLFYHFLQICIHVFFCMINATGRAAQRENASDNAVFIHK